MNEENIFRILKKKYSDEMKAEMREMLTAAKKEFADIDEQIQIIAYVLYKLSEHEMKLDILRKKTDDQKVNIVWEKETKTDGRQPKK